MKYRYKVSTDEIYDENHHTHTIYGIEVCLGEKTIKSVPDVFFEYEPANDFVHQCNVSDLSPIHLMDIIEDIQSCVP